MIALAILGIWLVAGLLIVALWGAIGVQWTRRAEHMERQDFHAHAYAKRLLTGARR